MAFVSEIEAQLRANNSDFRTKMAESGESVEKLDTKLKKFGLGFGGVAAIATAFRAIVDHARDLTGELDANQQRAKQFAHGLDEAKKAALDVGVSILGAVNGVGEWLGKQVAIVKYGKEQVALNEQIEKQTQETLKAIEKDKKQTEEIGKIRAQIREIEKKSTEEAAKQLDLRTQIAQAEAKLTEAKQAAARADLTKLERANADLAVANARVNVEKLYGEQKKKADEEAKKSDEERAKLVEKRQKLEFESLTAEEQRNVLLESEANLVDNINEAKAAGVDTTQMEIDLLEIQAKLAKEFAEVEKKAAEQRQKDADKHIEAADKLTKLRFDQLPPSEKVAALEKEQAQIQQSILRDKAQGKDTTAAEAALIETNNKLIDEQSKLLGGIDGKLALQYKNLLALGLAHADIVEKLKAGGASRDNIVKLEEMQAKAIEAQVEKLRAQGMSREAIIENIRAAGFEESKVVEITDKATKAAYGLNKEWDKFFVSLSRTGREAEDQSTIALEGAYRRAKAQLEELERDTSYQTTFAPNGKNPLYYTLMQEVSRMENELRARRDVSSYAARFGEDATRYKFGDTLTDKALRELQSIGERQQKDIERLTIAVTRSSLFRKTAPPS